MADDVESFMKGYERAPITEARLAVAIGNALRARPTERLGQMLMNLLPERYGTDLWNVPDEEWIELLEAIGGRGMRVTREDLNRAARAGAQEGREPAHMSCGLRGCTIVAPHTHAAHEINTRRLDAIADGTERGDSMG